MVGNDLLVLGGGMAYPPRASHINTYGHLLDQPAFGGLSRCKGHSGSSGLQLPGTHTWAAENGPHGSGHQPDPADAGGRI
jgi:hypothetical protein